MNLKLENSSIFTPENEPYLGNELLYHFDEIINSIMEQNIETAPKSFATNLTDHQKMASQLIPQSISLMLSIRELIRQGYLFGANVLLRPFIERVTILLYLHFNPNDIEIWNNGWNRREAPSLAKMFEFIQNLKDENPKIKGYELTADMNSLTHGKPDSAKWNIISIGKNGIGHAVSKILDRPDLCEEICANAIPNVAIVQSMMAFYFGDDFTA